MRLDDDVRLAESSAMDSIWRAAGRGDLGEVERLVVGHDPSLLDAKDGTDLGRTPLTMASANGHMRVVLWLLDRGAAMHERDGLGCTALYRACLYGRAPVVALLLERGADPTIAMNCHTTPLMIGCGYGGTEVVRCLLAHPSAAATMNRTDNRGRTALRYACQSGRGEVVRLLLKHGADPTIADSDGTTPRAIATALRHARSQRECVTALKVRSPPHACMPTLTDGPG
jgi:ankyrin repeat protein